MSSKRTKQTRYVSLDMLVRRTSQSEAARRLGCSQANISRMLTERRAVYVCLHRDGTASAVEVKSCIRSVDPDVLHDLGQRGIVGLLA